MTGLDLRIGVFDYDRTRALLDGSVKIDGVNAHFEGAGLVSEIFERMVRDRAFDVAELGMTFFLRTLGMPDSPFIALPIFPNRNFRHSAIFVNTDSGIKHPTDLIGKTVGEFATYGHDAGLWPKGVLSDDYGVTPDQCRWVVGGADWPMEPFDFVPFVYPPDVEVVRAPAGKALGPMLEAGEIDAMISALVPRCVREGSPKVARLFPDYETVEREYYDRTRMYPIMHTVVMRKELVAEHPGLARAVYEGFLEAKDSAAERHRHALLEQHMNVMIPWFSSLYERNQRQMPHDWFPYGVGANRHTIDTFLRYFHEQGFSEHRLTCEDIFVPELLDT
ncbi:4,5-dihydroxyphthalate decarboxylase [Streptomyces sp. NPDC048290]|uniref:4,5-dihydroxyphthalate decarboxylase n=1 Tax=Streptomyces sp. NPDC048290 TaxID=3155811 RepID=UPI00343C08BF